MIQAISKVALAAALMTSVTTTGLAQGAPGDCACSVGPATGVVSDVEGDVLISRNRGIRPASEGNRVGPQTTIAAGPGSSSTVTFRNRCEITISDGQQLTIEEVAGQRCAVVGAANLAGATPPGTAVAGAAGAPGAAVGSGLLKFGLIAGGVVGAAGIAAVLDDDDPVSN